MPQLITLIYPPPARSAGGEALAAKARGVGDQISPGHRNVVPIQLAPESPCPALVQMCLNL